MPPKGGVAMQLRPLVGIALALAAMSAGVLLGHRNAVAWQRAGGPECIPAELRRMPPERVAWVFVRPGCGHCADHLRALERAVQARPESSQAHFRAQIYVAGTRGDVPPGTRALADSLRDAFDIHIAPTTWWIADDGAICSAWRGARGEAAWNRGLDFLAGRSGVVP